MRRGSPPSGSSIQAKLQIEPRLPAWGTYRDTFSDEDAESLGLSPPSPILREPSGSIGKVWREHMGGPEGRIGWAPSVERRFVGAIQVGRHGLTTPIDTNRT